MNRKHKKGYLLVSFSILSFVVFFIYSFNRHNRFYSYSTEVNYDYSSLNTFDVKLENDSFTLPISIDSTHSVFARVKIKSSLFGNFSSPFLNLSSKKLELRQDFEYGTKGYRYVNLSNFAKINERSISIKTGRCHIYDDSIQLIYFKDIKLENAKIMIISPHPDDAEIASYGLYSSYPDSTYIITVTAGELGKFEYGDDINVHHDKNYHKGKIRTWNSLTIPLLAGIPTDNIVNLVYFDGTLKQMFEINPKNCKSLANPKIDSESFRNYNFSYLSDSMVKGSNWPALVSNMEFLLKKIEPDIIVTPYPYLDAHSDHKYSSISLFEALKNLKISKGNLFFYTNHYTKSEYYPYGLRGGIVSLPPNLNNDYYFKSIQSLPLNEDVQFDKFVALEAMIDIRPKSSIDFIKKDIFNFVKPYYPVESFNYFHRALRSNELFFVVPISDLQNDTIAASLVHGNSKH